MFPISMEILYIWNPPQPLRMPKCTKNRSEDTYIFKVLMDLQISSWVRIVICNLSGVPQMMVIPPNSSSIFLANKISLKYKIAIIVFYHSLLQKV